MLIEGPLKISVVDKADGLGRELHLDFTNDFRSLSLAKQSRAFQAYAVQLRETVSELQDDSANRQGMLTILQIVEQLLPHVASGDLVLEETIVVEIQPEFSLGSGAFGLRLN